MAKNLKRRAKPGEKERKQDVDDESFKESDDCGRELDHDLDFSAKFDKNEYNRAFQLMWWHVQVQFLIDHNNFFIVL